MPCNENDNIFIVYVFWLLKLGTKTLATFYMAFSAILKFISVVVTAEQNDTLFLAKLETRASLWSYDNA